MKHDHTMIHKFFTVISLFNLVHTSSSFVIPSVPVTTLEHKNAFCSTSYPSALRDITSTTVSAYASDSSSPPIPKENVNFKKLESLLDETLNSNSTAASYLLDAVNDAGDESVVDRLLQLVDKSPAWTKVRFLGKFSRRARRASLRRVINFTDGGTEAVSVRRKALVSVVQSIAGATSNDDTDTTLQSGGGGGITIQEIERDARRERKNPTPDPTPDPTPEREDINLEEERSDATAIERSRIQFTNEHKLETEEKAEEETEVAALPRATEQGVTVGDDEALKKAKEKREATALLKTIKERNEKFEAEKIIKREKEEAEERRLIMIRNEQNQRQRALLESRLELDNKYRASEVEKGAKQEAEQARRRMIADELDQRALLQSRLEMDRQYRVYQSEKIANQEAAELAARIMMVEANQRATLVATVEQSARDKTIALERGAQNRKALNAELERKQRGILEATLQQKTSDITADSESNEGSLSNKSEISQPNTVVSSLDKEAIVTTAAKDDSDAKNVEIARRQPQSEEERNALAEKYGSMELGLRAFTILDDLGMLDKV